MRSVDIILVAEAIHQLSVLFPVRGIGIKALGSIVSNSIDIIIDSRIRFGSLQSFLNFFQYHCNHFFDIGLF